MNPQWRLSHARGYLELRMFEQALDELDLLKNHEASGPEATMLRATIFQETARWKELQTLAAGELETQAGEPAWWILCAYAARRAQSIEVAERILLCAEALHPNHATIQFNLGCYACVKGDLGAASIRVRKALSLDPALDELSKTDPDLQALRDRENQSTESEGKNEPSKT